MFTSALRYLSTTKSKTSTVHIPSLGIKQPNNSSNYYLNNNNNNLFDIATLEGNNNTWLSNVQTRNVGNRASIRVRRIRHATQVPTPITKKGGFYICRNCSEPVHMHHICPKCLTDYKTKPILEHSKRTSKIYEHPDAFKAKLLAGKGDRWVDVKKQLNQESRKFQQELRQKARDAKANQSQQQEEQQQQQQQQEKS